MVLTVELINLQTNTLTIISHHLTKNRKTIHLLKILKNHSYIRAFPYTTYYSFETQPKTFQGNNL